MLKINFTSYFRIIILLLMITAYLPIVSYRLPPYIGSHHFYTIIWGISLLLLKPKVLFNRLILLVVFYVLFLWMMLNTAWSSMNAWNVRALWIEIYAISVGASIIAYFNETKDYEGFAKIIRWTLIFIIITAVFTLIATIINPMYVRLEYASSYEADIARQVAYKYGAGKGSMTLTFVVLALILIYIYKNNVWIHTKKWVLLLLIALMIIVVLRMQIFTMILFVLIFSLMAFVGVKNRKITIAIVVFSALIVMSIPTRIYVNSLNTMSKKLKNLEEVSFKLKEFAVYLERGGEIKHSKNAVAGRAERYDMLWEVFPTNPLLGCFYQTDSYGGGYRPETAHLYWMNKLTITGIVGITCFISIFLFFIYKEQKNMQNNYRYYFILSILAILFYGLFKNIAGRECWYTFFVIIPGINYLPLLTKKSNSIKDEKKDEPK